MSEYGEARLRAKPFKSQLLKWTERREARQWVVDS